MLLIQCCSISNAVLVPQTLDYNDESRTSTWGRWRSRNWGKSSGRCWSNSLISFWNVSISCSSALILCCSLRSFSDKTLSSSSISFKWCQTVMNKDYLFVNEGGGIFSYLLSHGLSHSFSVFQKLFVKYSNVRVISENEWMSTLFFTFGWGESNWQTGLTSSYRKGWKRRRSFQSERQSPSLVSF